MTEALEAWEKEVEVNKAKEEVEADSLTDLAAVSEIRNPTKDSSKRVWIINKNMTTWMSHTLGTTLWSHHHRITTRFVLLTNLKVKLAFILWEKGQQSKSRTILRGVPTS